ncbi:MULTISPECIES: ferredoxin [Mycolicibacterium]|uniref:Ferredoxin n=1 Tax=Mycolicibacterium gilvum TaxID=1804 RepID=A0A378SWU0_9MYCO|nr:MULTISPECIES: ferredoxin [Mycolicibacterium]MBV5242287.1 ferredoxin [Mycolicibacterium sp. PAM1]MCV7054059.1 ferredoxin [Mycolicibacterium gilvum]STZ46324.1 4Fe-4S ferredoxin [Mycolicibacterium gilvum]
MRVTVDNDSCAGHGACTVACPEVFVITDDGYAEATRSEIPAALRSSVADAIESCPEHAIHVVEENHVN